MNIQNFKDDHIPESNICDVVKKMIGEDREKGSIAILISTFYKYEGGSRAAEQQAKELSENGYNVTVFTFESNIHAQNFKVRIIKKVFALNSYALNKAYRGLFFFNIYKIISILNELKNFDLIILIHPTFSNIAYLAKRIYNIRVIYCNYHIDTSPAPPSNILEIAMKTYEKLFWPIYWALIRKLDTFVSISKFSRDSLKDKVGIDSIVIYCKIDDIRFKENLDSNFIRDQFQIGTDPLVLFVGRIIPSKGIHLLIDAFKIVKQEIPNSKLLLVGKHYSHEYSQKLLQMSDESIFFAGYVSDEDLPLYYSACNVYASCSLLEGFNLPLVEAQACGKPVIAFDIGPHREVVKNGYLVKENDVKEFAEKLVWILQNGRLY